MIIITNKIDMRKLFTLLAAPVVLFFSACSSTGATPDAQDLKGTQVSTYLIGYYVDVDEAKSRLESAVLRLFIDEKKKMISFTNPI